MLKTPITFCNFFFIWFTSFQRKCNQKQKKDNFFFSGNEFFVTKVNYSKGISIFFRMSSEMMNFVLESALGKRKGDFSPDMITELEAKVLTACNNFVYKDLTDFFNVKEFDKDMLKKYNDDDNNCNYIFSVH